MWPVWPSLFGKYSSRTQIFWIFEKSLQVFWISLKSLTSSQYHEIWKKPWFGCDLPYFETITGCQVTTSFFLFSKLASDLRKNVMCTLPNHDFVKISRYWEDVQKDVQKKLVETSPNQFLVISKYQISNYLGLHTTGSTGIFSNFWVILCFFIFELCFKGKIQIW